MSALPPGLEAKLNELSARVRRGALVQGLCRLALVLTILAVCFILIDAYNDLPRWLRCCLLGLWATTALALGKLWVRDPRRQALDRLGLAAMVEKQYPRLGERLVTAVELTEHPGRGNGSEQWMKQLLGDAEHRTKTLDFRSTVPHRDLWIFAGFTVAALMLMAVPLFFVDNSTLLLKRFALPWRDPAADAPYRIVASTGDVGVQRGGALTLAGYFEPTKPETAFPNSALLTLRFKDGQTESLNMNIEQGNVLFLRRERVDSDFEYRIESGYVSTEWHQVRVVEPIEIVDGGVEIVPPAYSRKPGDSTEKVAGLDDLHCIQYSNLQTRLKFNRAPQSIVFEWKADGAGSEWEELNPSAWMLQDDTFTVQSKALHSGSFRLRAQAEQGVQFDWPAQPLSVQIDLPPRFIQVSGFTEEMRSVRPEEVVPITCEVMDDFGVGPVHLEYRINQQETVMLPLTMKSTDPTRAEGRIDLQLKGKVKDTDSIEYRLVAFDNRSLPEEKLGPQRTVFPPGERWAELKISSTADPLDEQEVETRRKRIDDQLQQIVKELEDVQRGAYKIKIDSIGKRTLTREQADRLHEIREKTAENKSSLLNLAKENEVVPDLKSLIDGLRDVAEHPVQQGESALSEAQRTPGDPRQEKLQQSQDAVSAALNQIEKLRKLNDELARGQRVRQKIDRLGREEGSLAESAKGATPQQAADLDAKQRELEDKLKRLLADNEELRQAAKAGESRDARELESNLKDVTRNLRDLADAVREDLKQERAGKFSDLAKRQGDLASKIDDFVRRSETTARANQIPRVTGESAAKAEKDLREGRATDAVENQVKSALDLEKFAKEMADVAEKMRDPKVAAQKLASMQDKLRTDFAEATKDKRFAQLPDDQKAQLAAEQKALADAVKALKLPPGAGSAAEEQRKAIQSIEEAVDRLEKLKREELDDILQKSKDSLNRLAERLPALKERETQARKELSGLRNELETLTRNPEKEAKAFEKMPPSEKLNREIAGKLADSAKKLEKLGETLDKLDLPNQPEQLRRAREALKQALDDLKAGRAQDIAGSQMRLKREIERLEQAAAGQKAVEDQLAELAKQQKEIADDDKLSKKSNTENKDRDSWDRLSRKQSDLSRKLQAQNLTEAPEDKDDALTLTRKTETAMNDANLRDAAKSAGEAAEKLQRLADRVAQPLSPPEQAKRLAETQKKEADILEKLAAKKLTPQAISDQKKQLQNAIDELRQIPGGDDAALEKQKALEDLQKAIAATPSDLPKARKDAAGSVSKFADKLKPKELAQEPMPKQPAKADALPQASQAEEAQKLVEEQRKLNKETLDLKEKLQSAPAQDGANPLKKLIAKQKSVADQATELTEKLKAKPKEMEPAMEKARKAAIELASKAAQAATEAHDELTKGKIASTKDHGKMAKMQFDELKGEAPAKDLSKLQQEILDELDKLRATAGRSQQSERLEELRKDVNNLQNRFKQLADQSIQQPEVRKSAQKTSEAAQKADESLKQSQEARRENRPETAEKAMQDAIDALENALKDRKPNDGKGQDSEATAKAGQSLNEARKEMENARQELSQKQPQKAEPDMKKAAESLMDAAKRLAKSASSMPNQSANSQGSPGSNPNAQRPAMDSPNSEAVKHSAKVWGELSSESQAKILQDLKARYGEEYANKIRYYFETISERK